MWASCKVLASPRVSLRPKKKAEDITHEYLLAMGGVGQTLDQLEGVRSPRHPLGHAAVDNLAGDVDGLVQFGEPEAPVVVVQLERQPKRVHLAVTLVACLGPGDVHSLARRVMFSSSGNLASTLIGMSGICSRPATCSVSSGPAGLGRCRNSPSAPPASPGG